MSAHMTGVCPPSLIQFPEQEKERQRALKRAAQGLDPDRQKGEKPTATVRALVLMWITCSNHLSVHGRASTGGVYSHRPSVLCPLRNTVSSARVVTAASMRNATDLVYVNTNRGRISCLSWGVSGSISL